MRLVTPEVHTFHPPEMDGRELVIARVLPDQVTEYVPHVLRVLSGAYTRQFEKAGCLPEGAAQRRFNPEDPAVLDRQQERMTEYIRRGAAYWVALEPGQQHLVGVAKASDSRSLARGVLGLPPNCYLNDLAVIEPGQGTGSALTHVALGGYRPGSFFVADALPGTEGFFEQYDMKPRRKLNTLLQIGGTALELIRYRGYVGEVREAIEAKHPWLLAVPDSV